MNALLPSGKKTIVGVLHLEQVLGQAGFPGLAPLTARAVEDASTLVKGGVDALLVENFRDTTHGPFVEPAAVACLAHVCATIRRHVSIPVGVNVLPNDYRAAFALARTCDLAFVQLDVLSDAVRTDYSYSDAPPFDVRVDPRDLAATRARLGAGSIPLWGTIHPKHYTLLEPRPLEASIALAPAFGASAIVITGTRTGSAPDPERVAAARRAAGGLSVVVGSGLDAGNARDLLAHADGAIVGTAFRAPDLGPVDLEQVRAVVAAAREVHSAR